MGSVVKIIPVLYRRRRRRAWNNDQKYTHTYLNAGGRENILCIYSRKLFGPLSQHRIFSPPRHIYIYIIYIVQEDSPSVLTPNFLFIQILMFGSYELFDYMY